MANSDILCRSLPTAVAQCRLATAIPLLLAAGIAPAARQAQTRQKAAVRLASITAIAALLLAGGVIGPDALGHGLAPVAITLMFLGVALFAMICQRGGAARMVQAEAAIIPEGGYRQLKSRCSGRIADSAAPEYAGILRAKVTHIQAKRTVQHQFGPYFLPAPLELLSAQCLNTSDAGECVIQYQDWLQCPYILEKTA
jgi:hypothetical protein